MPDLDALAELLGERLPAGASEIRYGELSLTLPLEGLLEAFRLLRDDPDLRFDQLTDLCGLDWPGREARTELVYHLLSMRKNLRLRVKVGVKEGEAAPSLVELHPCADWLEREVFDMNGVIFIGHPDLRRILTDYGFRGHPLRKDFPTTGYVEVRYDEERKRVVYEPVKLIQEYRQFDFLSPWEGAPHILPGDDKAKAAPAAPAAKTGS